MKQSILYLSRENVYYIFKLLYLLIIVSALYVLKLNIYPESAYESMLAIHQTPIMLEYIFHSTAILICGGALFSRVFWFLCKLSIQYSLFEWIFIVFLHKFLSSPFLIFLKILHLIFGKCVNFDTIFGVFHGFGVWKSG